MGTERRCVLVSDTLLLKQFSPSKGRSTEQVAGTPGPELRGERSDSLGQRRLLLGG